MGLRTEAQVVRDLLHCLIAAAQHRFRLFQQVLVDQYFRRLSRQAFGYLRQVTGGNIQPIGIITDVIAALIMRSDQADEFVIQFASSAF